MREKLVVLAEHERFVSMHVSSKSNLVPPSETAVFDLDVMIFLLDGSSAAVQSRCNYSRNFMPYLHRPKSTNAVARAPMATRAIAALLATAAALGCSLASAASSDVE